MKFGNIEKQAEKSITFNDFSDGINENAFGPAKLLDVQNLSLKGKNLVSRKGLKIAQTPFYRPEALNFAEVLPNEFSVYYGGEYRKIIVFYETDDATYVKYGFKMLGKTETDLGSFRFTSASGGNAGYPVSVFVFAGEKTVGDGIYAVFSFASDRINMQGIYMRIYEYCNSGSWSELSDDDIYAPIIYKNGRGASYSLSEKEFAQPQYPEKPNMISKKTRYYFNADDASGVFYLPVDSLSTAEGSSVVCTVQTPDTLPLRFVISGSNVVSQTLTYGGQNVYMSIDRPAKKIQFNGFVPPFINDAENTIEVVVCQNSEENVKKFANMKFGMWYNAGSSGTRLFLSGNDFYPSLLMASVPDKPLYFLEENQFYVGDPTQKITALARQNKSLVVFKEKEIYCGSYSSGKFSVTHLHSAIGCDLPGSVALCGNRVVWATTEKCIYTLNALSDYGAVAVYRLSGKIENMLQNLDFTGACGGYTNDVYYLFLKDKVCVMNVSGALLQSNKQFLDSAAFTFWKLPQGVRAELAVGVGEELKVLCNTQNENGQIHYVSSFSGNSCFDEIMYRSQDSVYRVTEPFYSILKFDNCPNINAAKRSFHKAYISCYAENGVEAVMSDLTGAINKISRIDMKYTGLSLPAPYRIMPLIGGANMILELKSCGNFSFAGYTLYYKDFI